MCKRGVRNNLPFFVLHLWGFKSFRYICIMKTNISLYDHSLGVFVKIKPTGTKWVRYVSKNKKKWVMTNSFNTLDDALKSKEEVINNNYRNLLQLITKK